MLEEYAAFANAEEARLKQRVRRVLLSPALNLFTGEPFGKKYRAALDGLTKDDAETPIGDLLLRAADATLRADTLDAPAAQTVMATYRGFVEAIRAAGTPVGSPS